MTNWLKRGVAPVIPVGFSGNPGLFSSVRLFVGPAWGKPWIPD